MDQEKTITVVNKARHQATLADYELAQEDYRRKLHEQEISKSRAARQAALSGQDPRETLAELHALLARSDISAEDRSMLERHLRHAQARTAS